MLIFKSLADVQMARLPTHLAILVAKQMQAILTAHPCYDPSMDGYLILITPETTDDDMVQCLGWKWQSGMFEGITSLTHHASRFISALVLRDNQFAISILVPDSPEIDPRILSRLRG